MTEVVREQESALDPLRRALLANARAEADQVLRTAKEAGRQSVSAAQDDVAEQLARARAQGEADGAALLRADEAAARSAARSALLAAQRTAYDELEQRSREAVRALLREPGNRQRLASALRARLGEVAEVSDTDDGGLLARAPDGRTLDASVAALVDTALADLDLEQLWTAP